MEDAKGKLQLVLKEIALEMGISDIDFKIEKPKDTAHGDFSTNLAMAMFVKLQTTNLKLKTPLELAEKIVSILNTKYLILNTDFGKVEVAPPGFINFYFSKTYLLSELSKVLIEKDKYGSKNEDPNKKVVVEYSSPNIAKPFTVGHLRSTIIGDAIANLLVATGWTVYRDNHLGDWGTQFGKQIYAIKTWGDEEEIEKAKNPVKDLVALYVKFHEEAEKNPELEEKAREWFKRLEDGDKEARRLWTKCVDWSLKEFKAIYEKLGVKFTENKGLGYGESFFEDKLKDVVKELESKKLLKESEEAKLVFFPDEKLPPLMIIKKDGATLYATRDLATDKFREEKYGKDAVIINEVGIEQALYFKQLFEVEKMLGWYRAEQRIHKKHGHYRFKDEKMSTRKGNAIWLEDVLEEAEKRAVNLSLEKDTEIARKVAIGALKWNDLKRSSEQDIVFDWDDILNMQGDSGPYIQYVYARTQSVWEKSGKNTSFTDKQDLNSEELAVLRAINNFPEVIENAAQIFSPNIVCNYLFDLAQKFNLFYQKHKIIGSKEENFRLTLTLAVGQVIKNGLALLGISAPEKM